MAKIQAFKGYAADKNYVPKIPKPSEPVFPNIVTAQDGVPVKYPGCDGVGIRIVHPVNDKAPAKNLGIVMFCLPPHATLLPPGSHETEEVYVIQRGEGTMTFATGRQQKVKAGDFVHLPPWCEHGVENTGNVTLEILICTAPPNP
jgi:mannose-6-phosphate isomerase-like protein (cupin superfamily)